MPSSVHKLWGSKAIFSTTQLRMDLIRAISLQHDRSVNLVGICPGDVHEILSQVRSEAVSKKSVSFYCTLVGE